MKVYHGNVKGNVLLGLINYIKTKANHKSVEKLFRLYNERVPKKEHLQLDNISEYGWYPYTLFVRFIEITQKHIFPNDKNFPYHLGLHYTRLIGEYRVILKYATPGLVLKNTPKMWYRFFDSGIIQLEILEPGHARFVLFDYDPHPLICPVIVGFAEGTLKLTRCKNLNVRKVGCLLKGNKYCEFDVTWE